MDLLVTIALEFAKRGERHGSTESPAAAGHVPPATSSTATAWWCRPTSPDEVASGTAEQERLEEFLLRRIQDSASITGTHPPGEDT